MVKISLNNVTLNYPLYISSNMSIRKSFIDFFVSKKDFEINKNIKHITALKNISIELTPGDKLGVLGGNGAGKSSLLRVIAGIYPPTEGNIFTNGKISSLLDIFFGINMDATGRENILIRGILIGLSRDEINKIAEKIISYVDIGEFINYPMKTYSTGMKMRLAFAISINIPSDILLMDEWLSVGDKKFVEKAELTMINKISRTSIVVYASHQEDQVNRICNKVIKLKKGSISSYYEPS